MLLGTIYLNISELNINIYYLKYLEKRLTYSAEFFGTKVQVGVSYRKNTICNFCIIELSAIRLLIRITCTRRSHIHQKFNLSIFKKYISTRRA